jgi:Glycosyltransferase family 87
MDLATPAETTPPLTGPGMARRTGPRLLTLAGSSVVLVLASLAGSGLSLLSDAACRNGDWVRGTQVFQAHCYSDIYALYGAEGLSAGQVPYLDHRVEYPVLIGAAMQAAAWLVRGGDPAPARALHFFYLTVVLLVLATVAAVLAVAHLAGPQRRWSALLVALSPALVLNAFINWDLLAMSLATVGLAAWASRRGVLAGVLLGLAVAAKFYPIVFFWPLLLLCLRAGRMRAFWTTAGAAAGAWLAVNLPVALIAPAGWAWFYQVSDQRGADWGSIWYFFEVRHWPVVGALAVPGLNFASGLALCVLAALIGLLALTAPRRPRLPQLLFLAVAAFLLVNKVWSPQYVIWLVPLAVLARPRLGGYLLWQVAEVGYFYAIWAYLITALGGPGAAGGIGPTLYFDAVTARFDAVVVLAGLVVLDILRPAGDVVRTGGADDPAGGVLSDAADVRRLRLRPRQLLRRERREPAVS